MELFTGALIFWASLHVGLGLDMAADSQAKRIQSGEVAPIVVPKEAGIPWLTEKTIKDRKAWDLAHGKKS